MPHPCHSHAVPLPCRALIHTCHAAPLPCFDSAVSFVNVRVVAGNIRTTSPTESFFVVCCYHSFPRPCKRCLVSHWPPAFEIGMRLITTLVELRMVAGRSRTRASSPHARSRRPCCAVALRRAWWGWRGRGTASVNQTRPHCVNQIGKTHSKPSAARHGRGTACYV